MFSIEKRAAELAGFNHSYCEDIQMACYQEGELHGLHRDDANATVNADRAATVLIYLRSPGEGGGGETLFTMKEIERERDLKTGGPLTSEDGALDLFKLYCEKPKNNMIVVAPFTKSCLNESKHRFEAHAIIKPKFSARGNRHVKLKISVISHF